MISFSSGFLFKQMLSFMMELFFIIIFNKMPGTSEEKVQI